MVFKLTATYSNPGQGSNAQRGFPAPGSGAQTTGEHRPGPRSVPWNPLRAFKGRRTWSDPTAPESAQRGFPGPQGATQRRTPGEIAVDIQPFGGHEDVVTPYFSRGAAGTVVNLGQVLSNPIGAGVVALNRPQASYGPAGQYDAGAIWWTSQVIPTTIHLQGLNSPQVLAAILGPVNVQGVVRTTG